MRNRSPASQVSRSRGTRRPRADQQTGSCPHAPRPPRGTPDEIRDQLRGSRLPAQHPAAGSVNSRRPPETPDPATQGRPPGPLRMLPHADQPIRQGNERQPGVTDEDAPIGGYPYGGQRSAAFTDRNALPVLDLNGTPTRRSWSRSWLRGEQGADHAVLRRVLLENPPKSAQGGLASGRSAAWPFRRACQLRACAWSAALVTHACVV